MQNTNNRKVKHVRFVPEADIHSRLGPSKTTQRTVARLYLVRTNRNVQKRSRRNRRRPGVKSFKMTDVKDFITERRWLDARFVSSVFNCC